MSEPSIAPKPVSLTWPFAVAGFVGGWLSADSFKPHSGAELRVLLAGVTPVVAALLGRFLTRRIHGGPLRTALVVTASIIGAGMINGMVLGLFLGAVIGMMIGVPFGALFALPFLPALALMVLLARRVGRARPGSAVDASDRRAVWGAVALSASLATLVPLDGIFGRFGGDDTVAFAALSLGVLLALFLVDGAALVRLAQVQRALRAIDARVGSGPLPAVDGEASVIDFGLGSEGEQLEELAPAAGVYRDRQRVTRVFRGDLDAAGKALVWAMVLELGALCLALGALMLHVSSHLGGWR